MWPTAHFAVGCLLPYQEWHTGFAKTSQWLCVECAFCFVCARYDGQCFSRLLFHLQVKFKVVFHRTVLKELQQNKTCKNGGAWDLPTNQEAKPFRLAPFSGTTDSAASLHVVLHTDGGVWRASLSQQLLACEECGALLHKIPDAWSAEQNRKSGNNRESPNGYPNNWRAIRKKIKLEPHLIP